MEAKIVNVPAKRGVKQKIKYIPLEDFAQYAKYAFLDRRYNHMGALQAHISKVWGNDAAELALKEYDVWLALNYQYNGLYGAAFVQRDVCGKIRNVKKVAYKDDGHRVKDGEKCLVWNSKQNRYENNTCIKCRLIGKRIASKYRFAARQCLFGEHLLARYPDKPVAIVEYEENAVVCSMAAPEYVWLATSGRHGCRWYHSATYKILKGRKVALFPKLGAEHEWATLAEGMVLSGIDVSIFSLEKTGCVTDEDRVNGLNIADYFTRLRLQEHPESLDRNSEESESFPITKKASAPVITAALSKLTPVTD